MSESKFVAILVYIGSLFVFMSFYLSVIIIFRQLSYAKTKASKHMIMRVVGCFVFGAITCLMALTVPLGEKLSGL